MKKVYYLCLFAAFSALLSLVSGCVDNLQPNPEELNETFVLTVNASKAAMTKALNYDKDAQSILATWSHDEYVYVYKGTTLIGDLRPTTEGSNTTTLTGTLYGQVSVNDQLILSYGSNNYAGQDGTLNYNNRATSISKMCNYALDTVTVNQINGHNVATEDAHFVSQQAILRLTFRDEMGGVFLPKSVTVRYDSSGEIILTGLTAEHTYTYTDYLFIALPGFSDGKLVIEATAKDDKKYYYENNNTTINNGTFYRVNLYMFNELTSPLTFEAINDGTTVSFTKYGSFDDRTVQYQINPNDSGQTFPGSVTLQKGEKIKFRGTNLSYAKSYEKYYR